MIEKDILSLYIRRTVTGGGGGGMTATNVVVVVPLSPPPDALPATEFILLFWPELVEFERVCHELFESSDDDAVVVAAGVC